MFWIVLLLVLLPQDGVGWLWPLTDVEEGEEKLIKPTRPLYYHAPVSIATTSTPSSLAKDTSELSCRYQLSQNLIREQDACRTEANLNEVSRIATVCHYVANQRDAVLPAGCHLDAECCGKMDSEAFGVYSLFRVHAETICREMSSEAWRRVVEEMMESLAAISERAIDALHRAHADTAQFYREQRQLAMDLQRELELVSSKYAEQTKDTAQQFAQTQAFLQEQSSHLTLLQTSMRNFSHLADRFDAVHNIVRELRASHEWSLVAVVDRVGFYSMAMCWIKFTSWLLFLGTMPNREFIQAQLTVFVLGLALELSGWGNHQWLRTAVIFTAPLYYIRHLITRQADENRALRLRKFKKI
ncbi:hypothetical protein BASA81_000668 [Batrachochytrium salamandrivorans]|nr:hypothetical protein BASA81_000668 [Batrachochytrium salamandrivorans]